MPSQRFVIFFVMATMFLLGMGVDIYTPSLPAVATYFSASGSTVKLTIVAYMLGYGLLQIVIGTLSDTWGRRKLLLGTLLLYFITAVLIPFSPNMTVLLLLRLLQGMAVAGPAVIGRVLISDIFPASAIPKASTYVVIAWGLGPVIAPFIGGYLAHVFGWQSTFFFLAIYSLFVFLLYLRFPETIKQRSPLSRERLASNFKLLLSHPAFIGCMLCMGMLYGVLLAFNVVGPFLIEHTWGYSVIQFGYVALFMGFGWFLGSLSTRFMLHHHSSKKIVTRAFPCLLITSAVFVVIALSGVHNIWVTIIPTFFLFLFGGMIFPNLLALCLRLFPHIGGTASAALGTFFVTGAAFISFIASFLNESSQLSLAVMDIILVVLVAIAYRLFIHRVL